MIPRSSNISFTSDWIGQIPSSIALLNKDLCFVSASPNWLTKFDLDGESIANKNIFEIFPHFSKEWETRLNYCLDGLNDIKIIDHAKNGDLLWNLNYWKDGYGNTVGIILKVEELSRTKELELQLKKTQNLLDQKGKIAKIGSWEFKVQTNTLSWSSNTYHIYGLPETEKPTLEIAFGHYAEGESRNTIKKRLAEAIENGSPWNENLKLIKANGKPIWVNSIGRPKFLEGKCVRVIGTVQDITESYTKQTKQEVNALEDELPIIEDLAVGLVVIDILTGTVRMANKKALSIAGLDKSELLNSPFSQFLEQTTTHKLKSSFLLSKKEKSYGPVTLSFRTPQNVSKTISVSGNFIKSKKQRYLLATLLDITTEYNSEKRLKSRLREVESHNDQLVNFAHTVSHNLKAHTTNFSLLLNFMAKEDGDVERKKLLGMLFEATENLSETIRGLREIVAISNNLSENKKRLMFNESLFRVEKILLPMIKKHDFKIINEIPDQTVVFGIEAYLESILTNCLSNAIKYRNPEKSPIIILSSEKTKKFTIVHIEDNGLGIDLQKHGQDLFGLFKTFHGNKDAKGLGLYLVKKQVEAMGGKIKVNSKLNEGTTFSIFFKND